jgi:hypothetical protein
MSRTFIASFPPSGASARVGMPLSCTQRCAKIAAVVRRPGRQPRGKGAELPLSEHEQRVLHELEQALVQEDPAFADRVRSETVYRHAGRYLKWSILGFVAGLVVMLVFFTTSVAVGFIGVLIMFGSLVVFWTNLHRMGKAGLEDIGRSLRKDGLSNAVNDTRTWLRERFRRNRP